MPPTDQMKRPRRHDLVAPNGEPLATHVVGYVAENVYVYFRKRGDPRQDRLTIEQWCDRFRWDEDHGLAGAWVPRSA